MSNDEMKKTSSDLHGRVISYQELKQTLPSRFEILDSRARSQVTEKLKTRSPVLFLPNYLTEINFQDKKYQPGKYKILLSGIFQDGRRATVMLNGIEPYFEVKIPFEDEDGLIPTYVNREKTYITKKEYIRKLRKLIDKDPYTKPIKITKVYGKPFKYFQEQDSMFIRFYYHKDKNRRAAIKLVRQNGYETASDDLSCYYRVACRNYLTSFSSWVELTDYKATQIDRVKGMTYKVNIKNFRPYEGELKGDLMRDKTLSMVWDIETWSKSNDVPLPDDPDARIFCIGLTLQWIHEQKPFLRIALCDLPCNPNPDYLTVVCGREKNLIRAFADVFSIYKPEFIAGFNDSDYDWPWLVERAAQTKGELVYLAKKFNCFNHWAQYNDKDVMKFNYKKESVKLEATTSADGRTFQMDGYINIDVRTIFRKLYPTAEKSSLKWFLSKNKLGGKEDMPYKRMFKIYEKMCAKVETLDFDYDGGQATIDYMDDEYKQLLHDYMEINKYCVVDAQRCHELLKIRNVVMDKRAVSKLAYCSVHDSFYRADSMKVRNLTIAVGQDPTLPFNIRFTNIGNDQIEEGKYPGAYVFPPEKGLKVTKLSIDERITKGEKEWIDVDDETKERYYDIIETYGPVQDDAGIEEIEKIEGKLDTRFKKFLREKIGRPITGLDFSSLYPSLMRAYNFSPEKCIVNRNYAKEYYKRTKQRLTKVEFDFNGRRPRGWFPWHNNAIDPTKPDFAFGLYPYILDDLFNKRKQMKKGLHKYAHMLEEMEAKGEEWLQANANEYEDAAFNYASIDSKQKALKVFMNTFYGVAGQQRSPFFVVQVAGGITSYGQTNIKMAQAKVEEEGCHVSYGDTDSIYLSVPEKSFTKWDKLFYSGKLDKLEYWTKLVETTFEVIKPLNKMVNDMFLADNGTRYLSMAYEEVLYPVMFTAKKKYFGIPHENIVNFKPKNLFIRGLEVKKRGVSQLLRDIFNELMWKSCSVDNLQTVIELVEAKIDEIYARKWEMHHFLQSAVFRPKKQNISVHTFAHRMAERGITVPEHERFNYVIVKRYPFKYDYRGRKSSLSTGELMEFPEEAEKNGWEMDLDYYMKGSVNGQLARLVTYHPIFQVQPHDPNDADDIKTAEDKTYKNACKYIDNYCKKYYANYNQFGKAYQKAFKIADKIIGGKMQKRDSFASSILGVNVKTDDIENWLLTHTEKQAIKLSKNYGETFIKQRLEPIPNEQHKEKIETMQRIYFGLRDGSIKDIRARQYRQMMSVLRRRIADNTVQIKQAYGKYHVGINHLSNKIKEQMNLDEAMQETTTAAKLNLDDFDVDLEEIQEELDVEAEEYTKKLMEDSVYLSAMDEFKKIYSDLLSAQLIKARTDSIVEALKEYRDRRSRVIRAPERTHINKTIEAALVEDEDELLDLDI